MNPYAEHLVQIVIQGVLVLGVLTAFVVSLRRDARALRNGFLLIISVYAVLTYAGNLLSLSPELDVLGQAVSSAVFLLLLLGILVLPLVLVGNGLVMVRREGRTLGNLLSLLAGLALLSVPIVAFILVRNENRLTGTLLVTLFITQALLGILFLTFLVHALLYARVAGRARGSAIIILGSGLIGGQVPPLLSARLQTAIDASAARHDGVVAPKLVPSGAQGPDEPRSEGAAMAEWLQDHGVPASEIIAETKARTTEENLRFSVALLQERMISGPYLIATNNYHAPRAAMIARDLGIDAHALGSKTAFYFLPSAFLREFIAVMSRQRLVLALCAAFIVASAALVWPLVNI